MAALDEAGLHPGDEVVVEVADAGEVRLRRRVLTFESAFGTMTGAYPHGYLENLDREDAAR